MIKFPTASQLKNFAGYTGRHRYIIIPLSVLSALLVGAWILNFDAERRYNNLISVIVYDRHGIPLSIRENSKGHYVHELTTVPANFVQLLISKEDRFFYYHLGINPISSARAFFNYISSGNAGGSSTLTQQLAKNLLGTETNRTIRNKFIEAAYAFSLEIYLSKDNILKMYANTVYLGNQIQGFGTASHAYFDKSFYDTTQNERLSLLATLAYPSTRNPWQEDNTDYADSLNTQLTPNTIFVPPKVTDQYSFQDDAYFELRTAGVICPDTCVTTVDSTVTRTIRDILDLHIIEGWDENIRNGAVVVFDAKNSELIALIGSRDPRDTNHGNQINMAIEPRPIGSTIKPIIYTKGFIDGLRPYTLVEDREYKYPIATGFSLYPKNYDGQYNGEITLHEALSNSLNVPSVKVLEYIELDNFYRFMDEALTFKPIQSYDSYQYGIALGGLEMDLMTLTHYFTMFPQKGFIAPVRVLRANPENFSLPPQSNITSRQQVSEAPYIELVHAIISDRFTGVNQFGLTSNLNLTTTEYGVKTGTSRDYHDSWVIGYTPDFVVGVWIGNSENTPLTQVSGAAGAGAVWHDVMEYLLNTEYNTKTAFTFNHLERYPIATNDEWAIRGDTISNHRTLLQDSRLILSLHPGDTFELRPQTTIPLRASQIVTWTVNGESFGRTQDTSFSPTDTGTYEISAYDEVTDRGEIVTIQIIVRE